MRVLVVEDEAIAGEAAHIALRRAGYAVDYAADGERAGLLGHDERYDAVVLDLGLPEVDGLTFDSPSCRKRDSGSFRTTAQKTYPATALMGRCDKKAGGWLSATLLMVLLVVCSVY